MISGRCAVKCACGAFRARLQSALTLEEVLIRHPKLRVYIMHAGYPMLDDLLALLFSYPQVYVEPSMAINVETRPAFTGSCAAGSKRDTVIA